MATSEEKITTLATYLANILDSPTSKDSTLLDFFANTVVGAVLPESKSMNARENKRRSLANTHVQDWYKHNSQLLETQVALDSKIDAKEGAKGKNCLVNLFLRLALLFLKLRKNSIDKRVDKSNRTYLTTEGVLAVKKPDAVERKQSQLVAT